MNRSNHIISGLFNTLKKSWKGLVLIAIAVGTMSFADYYFEISKNIDIFSALFKEVNTYYVDDVEPSKLMRDLH